MSDETAFDPSKISYVASFDDVRARHPKPMTRATGKVLWTQQAPHDQRRGNRADEQRQFAGERQTMLGQVLNPLCENDRREYQRDGPRQGFHRSWMDVPTAER